MKRADIFLLLTEYDIRHVATEDMPQEESLGLCDMEKKVIYVDRSQTTREKADTIIHELQHAYSDRYGRDWSEETVERKTSKLVTKLFGVDNEDVK